MSDELPDISSIVAFAERIRRGEVKQQDAHNFCKAERAARYDSKLPPQIGALVRKPGKPYVSRADDKIVTVAVFDENSQNALDNMRQFRNSYMHPRAFNGGVPVSSMGVQNIFFFLWPHVQSGMDVQQAYHERGLAPADIASICEANRTFPNMFGNDTNCTFWMNRDGEWYALAFYDSAEPTSQPFFDVCAIEKMGNRQNVWLAGIHPSFIPKF